MHIGPKVGSFEKDASHTEASTPQSLNKGVLLRGVYSSRPVANLLCRQKVKEEMGHKLTALISDDDVWDKFVREAHVHTEISEKEFQTTLGDFLRRGVTWEDAHQTRARINSATVAGVTMREARGQRPFKIKVYEGARGRDLIRIPKAVKGGHACTRSSHSVGYGKVVTKVSCRWQAIVNSDVSNAQPDFAAGVFQALPEKALRSRMGRERERGQRRRDVRGRG